MRADGAPPRRPNGANPARTRTGERSNARPNARPHAGGAGRPGGPAAPPAQRPGLLTAHREAMRASGATAAAKPRPARPAANRQTALQPAPPPTLQPAPPPRRQVEPPPPAPTERQSGVQLVARTDRRVAAPPKAAPVARRRHAWPRITLRVAGGLVALGMLLATLGWGALQNIRAAGQAPAAGDAKPGFAAQVALALPAASGHGPASGPWASTAAVSIVVPTGGGEPCTDPVMFVPDINQWTVPPGCYGDIYRPNPANYVPRPGYGWCNWWVRVRHPDHPDITENKSYPEGGKPIPGAAVFFFGNVQGADSNGHWAQVVAIAPDNYWVLISEMNFAWRGAGWTRVDYRYIHVGPGVVFVYA